MNRYLYILISVLVSIFLSCTQPRSASPGSDANTIVSQFFDWYINKVYPETQGSYLLVSYQKHGDKKYTFNEQEYQKKIASIPFFTQSLGDSLIDQIQQCNTKMLEYDWDYEPEPQFN